MLTYFVLFEVFFALHCYEQSIFHRLYSFNSKVGRFWKELQNEYHRFQSVLTLAIKAIHIFFACFTPIEWTIWRISPLSHVVGTGVQLLCLLKRSESSRLKFPLMISTHIYETKLTNSTYSFIFLYGIFFLTFLK